MTNKRQLRARPNQQKCRSLKNSAQKAQIRTEGKRKVRNKNKTVLFSPNLLAKEVSSTVYSDLTHGLLEYTTMVRSNAQSFSYQNEGLLKKFFFEEGNDTALKDRLEIESYKKTREMNNRMRFYNYKISKIDISVNSTDYLGRVLYLAKGHLRHVLGDFDLDEVFDSCRSSTGTTIGCKYKNCTIEAKFRFPITSTLRASRLMDEYFRYDRTLDVSASFMNKGGDSLSVEKYKFITGSQATSVEKTSEKRRMIAKEPTVNMYLQQGLMTVMYYRMKDVGIDLSTLPDTHKELAFVSSITGSNATIDFSSASDCVSYELVRRIFPPAWFWALDIARSPFCTFNGKEERLAMYSTMGNATTFPVETLVFWSLGTAIIQLSKSRSTIPDLTGWGSVSVFGDDCIVPTESASLFCNTMRDLGCVINDDKSFCHGPFRESCGGDYHTGIDVRPYSIGSPVSNLVKTDLAAWLYLMLNELVFTYKKLYGPLTYIYDRQAYKYLFSLFRRYRISLFLVPNYFPDDSGFKTYGDLKRMIQHYGIEDIIEPLSVDRNGTVVFHSLVYRHGNERIHTNGNLRYSLELKRLRMSDRITSLCGEGFTPKFVKMRQGGRYHVVAGNRTGHWPVGDFSPH